MRNALLPPLLLLLLLPAASYAAEPESAGPTARYLERMLPEFSLVQEDGGPLSVRLYGEAARYEAFHNAGDHRRAAERFARAAKSCADALAGLPAYDSQAESPYTKDLRLSMTSTAYRYFAFCSLFEARSLLASGDPGAASARLEALLRSLARPRRSGYRLLDRELGQVETSFAALSRYTLARARIAAGQAKEARKILTEVAALDCHEALTLYRLSLGRLREDDPLLAASFSVMDAAKRLLSTLEP